MLIKSIKMTNWCSFLGEHVIEFNPKDKNSVYAFFGDIGKGKSSIVEAIEWALFGTVWDTVIVDEQIKRKRRPLIDISFYYGKKTSFALPLLTDKAFRNRDYRTEIEINFTHQEGEWILLRSAGPKSTHAGIPQKVSDMEVYVRLEKKGGEITTTTESPDAGKNSVIQRKIEEIIPEAVSRFFFIRGDSVQEFTGLIQGDEKSTTLREQVDTVVGIPAITRSQKEFRRMTTIAEDRVRKMRRKNMNKGADKTRYDSLESDIERIEQGFEDNGTVQKGLLELEDLKLEMDGRKGILSNRMKNNRELRELLGKTKAAEENLDDLREEIPNLKKSLKQTGEGIWKIIIQRNIKNKIIELNEEAIREKEINTRISIIEGEIPHLVTRLDSADGVVPCPTCEKNRDALTDIEREKLGITKKNMSSERNKLIDERELIEGSLDKQNKLKDWRTDSLADGFTDNYENLWKKYDSIDIKEKELQRMKEALKDQNVKDMEDTQDEYEEISNQLVDIDHDIKHSKIEIENIRYEQTKLSLSKDGPQVDDVSSLGKVEKKESMLKWIEEVWEQSLDEYRENIRKSIDQICTERWLATVAEPEKYSKVKTTINWGVDVYGKDGNYAATGNPGHRSLLALCFIESLRFCSEIEFPLILDNPSASIDQSSVASILEYYMKNSPGQFIVLSHSSGMREDEMMELYNEDIDKAWKVDWIKGEDRNSELRLIGG